MVIERPSVQAVIYDRENRALLLIEKMDLAGDTFAWRLVKGGVDEGETDAEALRREIHEEVGLIDVRVRQKVHYYEFTHLDKLHKVSCYLVEASGVEAVSLQGKTKDERPILNYAWLPLEEALERLYFENEKDSVKASIPNLQ